MRFGFVESPNWPPFSAVLAALYHGITDGELLEVIASSMWRMVRGYLLGCAAGVSVGIAIALWSGVRLALTPTIELLRPVPVTAIVPPLIFVSTTGSKSFASLSRRSFRS